jgi:ATP-dependent Zn protease
MRKNKHAVENDADVQDHVSDDTDLFEISHEHLISAAHADVGAHREYRRMIRWTWLAFGLTLVFATILRSIFLDQKLPTISLNTDWIFTPTGLIFFWVIISAFALTIPFVIGGKSPHVEFAPGEIETSFDDLVGIGPVKEEVLKTLNLFLLHKTFNERMGGNPRRGILFEGPPGTGKTLMAKAMAREAGVPFFFVSSSAFQSMYYGQTEKKLRSFFRVLRKAARREGGAIGFIEELDAIASSRGNVSQMIPMRSGIFKNRTMQEGHAGVVNELLVQLQSFWPATTSWKLKSKFIAEINKWLPLDRQIKRKAPPLENILIIGATNRATSLDPALLRPGRFDRVLHFDLPGRTGRREIIDYYLRKKRHNRELRQPNYRNQLAAALQGYSPAMIEHVFDEALILALRDGRDEMNWKDVQQAKIVEEIGLGQPVDYAENERKTIATHEAGHTTVAYLVAPHRNLDVLSIIKRADALGLLAHSEDEERFTKTRSELLSSIKIAFGGMVAEELFFGEASTGPSSDLTYATRTAALMVGAFGMGSSLISYEAVESSPMGKDTVAKILSSDEGYEQVNLIMSQSKDEVRELLDAHRHLVMALRDALLERNELIGDEIIEVLRDAEAAHLRDNKIVAED